MTEKQFTGLLIEDNPGDARLIQEALAEVLGEQFDLKCADRLSTGLSCLAEGGIDVVLLDLLLPDSRGLDTLRGVHSQSSEVPVVILTGVDSEQLAINAVKAGAQDYLVKGRIDGHLIVRAILYAIERNRFQAALRDLLLIDDLTGLYNRRGFLTFGEQQLKLAYRTKRALLLIMADLDGMKLINDTFGHLEGDRALIETANILKSTFRGSDIIARIGGDEFAIVAIDAKDHTAEIINSRLRKTLEAYNADNDRPYKLSISIGIARYDPECPCFLEELLVRADQLMYEQKRARQRE